ncbi:hypothetical protein BRC79_10930 [Halobacteriales archaeon QH_8_67_27]|nr:MAG: hypothetical protein BRC79_10930 [Halobacteriales archaeon QH_8_67_27]
MSGTESTRWPWWPTTTSATATAAASGLALRPLAKARSRSVAVGVVGALELVEVGAVDGSQFAGVDPAAIGVAYPEEREVVLARADDAVDAGVEVGVVAHWPEVVGDAGV